MKFSGVRESRSNSFITQYEFHLSFTSSFFFLLLACSVCGVATDATTAIADQKEMPSEKRCSISQDAIPVDHFGDTYATGRNGWHPTPLLALRPDVIDTGDSIPRFGTQLNHHQRPSGRLRVVPVMAVKCGPEDMPLKGHRTTNSSTTYAVLGSSSP